MTAGLAIGATALAAWIYLLAARGGFWLARERDDGSPCPLLPPCPSVTAIVPARNEAAVAPRAIASLLAQDYPGSLRVILVDDGSDDGTGDLVRALGQSDRLAVLDGAAPPPGWTGKLWALEQGVRAADAPDWLWLTDADIAHEPDNLSRLVARARAERLVLGSQMARLGVASFAERLLIPAFVFFFAMLYPFRWVNDPRQRTAAAAGGCVLIRRQSLEAAGGIGSIRSALIDDCALAARLKRLGPIRLELSSRARSLRPYGGFGEIADMVARSAYAQLRYSPALLAAAVAGMVLVYLSAPLIAIAGPASARWLGLAAWLAMSLGYQPMLRFYRLSPVYGLAMPIIAAVYTGFTLLSAWRTWRGRGGLWKGRVHAMTTPA